MSLKAKFENILKKEKDATNSMDADSDHGDSQRHRERSQSLH